MARYLTAAQTRRVLAWIGKHRAGGICLNCGEQNKWDVCDACALPAITPKGVTIKEFFTVIPVRCKKCSAIVFYGEAAIGVIAQGKRLPSQPP